MSDLLKGKVAVITGAGQGIGKAIALEYAKNGADVVILDINLDNAKEVAKEVTALGQKSLALKLDVSKVEEIRTVFQEIVKEFPVVDIWFNDAGISQNVAIDELTEADWDRVMNVNVRGMFFCSQEAFKLMKKQNHGKIISIASMAGERGGRFAGANYSASKAGVIVLTKCFALNGGQYNITANAIAPGLIRTKMAISLGETDQEHPDIPLGHRMGEPEEVARVALFLASDLSNYVSGDVVDVNGGQFMR